MIDEFGLRYDRRWMVADRSGTRQATPGLGPPSLRNRHHQRYRVGRHLPSDLAPTLTKLGTKGWGTPDRRGSHRSTGSPQ